MGDSNLRWHGRFDNEHDILGPYIFGHGTCYLESHKHNNRDMGVELLRANKLIYLNSHFDKPPRNKATYRQPNHNITKQ